MAETSLKTLSGTIYDAYNAPTANITIQAYDKDLRTAQLLGETKTDAAGLYTISYGVPQYADDENQTADIFIRVIDADKVIVAESPVHFNVPPNFVLDFKIDNTPLLGLNEFDALVQKLKPLIAPQKIAFADLQETDKFKDISFLSGETNEDAAKIAFLPIAFTLFNTTKIAPDIFYGLFRLKFPTDLNALLLIKSESIAQGITTAISENIISAKWNAQVVAILSLFNQLATSAVLSGVSNESKAFKQVMGIALPKPEQQQTFVTVFLANEKTPEAFWQALSKENGFTDAGVITGIQNLLKLNVLTHYQSELTALLYAEQQKNTTLKDIRGFAAFSKDDWSSRIQKSKLTNFPDGIAGDTVEEKTENYAKALAQLIGALYPTDVFAHRLSKDTSNAFSKTKSDLTIFFASNASYDLKCNRINTQLGKADFTGINDKQSLKKELATINRLSKITDEYSQVSTLHAEGITSATALISKYSIAQFVQKFAPSITAESATAVYKNAQQVDSRSAALALGIKMRNDIPVYAINGPANDAPPDYVSMFGDTNCDCEHCQSVYSPSAYFVDILHLIKQHNPDAFTRLTTRRPDLLQILLTCKNTNTPLPYIDLVNELLENKIAPPPSSQSYQTTNSAEELLAYPEHSNATAYARLKTATSVFDLPLNLPREETRLYLDKLGVKRHALIELYLGKQANTRYDNLPVAAEYLQLSKIELDIVNGTTPMPVSLNKVTDFLRDTGLNYVEMLQLLECYFINPMVNGQRSIKIVSTTPDQATCKIEDLKLQTTITQSLKIKPFIRLWKKTGWNILDLDRAFTALGVLDLTGDVNKKLIVPISHIARLKEQHNLDVRNTIALWSAIDTAIYYDHTIEGQPKIPTRFEELFQNKKITNPPNPAFANPNSLSGTLLTKEGIIAASLNLTHKEFEALVKIPSVGDDLTLQNLSVLFRYATLAKTLKITASDVADAVDMLGVNPFGNALRSADTLTFIDKIALIRTSGFSIAELTALLKSNPASSQPIDVNECAEILSTLREGLKKIELLNPQQLADNKMRAWSTFISDTLGTAFKTESKILNVLINELVKSAADITRPAITSFVDELFIASQGALYTVDATGTLTWTFPQVAATYHHVRETWNRILKLIETFKISTDEFIFFQKNEVALDIAGIWSLPAQTLNSFKAFEKLYHFIRFRNTLSAPAADWFTIFDLAIANNANAKKNFIHTLGGLSNLTLSSAQYLLGNDSDINDKGALGYTFPADYLGGEPLLTALNCMSMATRLESSLQNISNLTIPEPTDTQEVDAAVIAKNILKSKYDIATWLSVIGPLSNDLRIKKRNALVNYILTSPEPGLVTFRQQHTIVDTNSLFAHFLIDTEMDACMITSRIKQAISSLQLFIDRCLMNLEAGITLGADLTTQWNMWRKRYRVWEANRKIFLYPENWIEPELRDDKSPLFKELEAKLRQNEITEETAEDALRFYLEKLDTIANLEMVGVYPDKQAGVVYAIGRTQNIPHQYYYTKQKETVWSAWEKVDLDIEGDHILPVVWNSRLMLLWAVFNEKQQEDSAGFKVPPVNGVVPPPEKYFEIKVAWSEFKNEKWTAKKVSKEAISTLNKISNSNRTPVTKILLASAIIDNKLYIRLLADAGHTGRYFSKQKLDSFCFGHCNSAPSIVPNSAIPLEHFEITDDARISGMSIKEKIYLFSDTDHPLTLYNTGLAKNQSSQAPEVTLLNNTPGVFRLIPNHHNIAQDYFVPFFYGADRNNFYVRAESRLKEDLFVDLSVLTEGIPISRKVFKPFPTSEPTDSLPTTVYNSQQTGVTTSDVEVTDFSNVPPVLVHKHYTFQNFYHPHVCELIKTLNISGIDGLYKNQVLDTDGAFKDGIQNRTAKDVFIPNGTYSPTSAVKKPYPVERVDFDYGGVYSIYNWELFYHIPLLIATRLSQNQKFDEARKWFHYIFDPTRSSSPASGVEGFWITNPFKAEIQRGVLSIEELIGNATPDLDLQLRNWERNPFKPHAVARLRTSAYMRATVRKYIDNIIAWGDRLFQQDTIESINEATLLYVLAANILGKKPERIPARAVPAENSFSTIQDRMDSFGNAKVEIQSFFSLSDFNAHEGVDNSVLMPLFCIPKNDVLLRYWDTVSDRLFKIRHCLNAEGVFRQLPLFEPPIDPALLVKGTAAGLDLNSILNEISASLPAYRFQVMLQKANELCNDVKVLGSVLQSALEKKDGEQLALIRSGHELKIIEAIRDIKVSQRDEAKQILDSLNGSKNVIEARRDFYGSREFRNAAEQTYFKLTQSANTIQGVLELNSALACISYLIPQTNIGPFIMGVQTGGMNFGNAAMAALEGGRALAGALKTGGELANLIGTFQRRQDEWTFQKQSAELELKQVDKQIAAAEIRLSIAETDLENNDLQQALSNEVDDYLRSKFTNEELYDYMAGQISSVFFKSYQLAFNTAKQAQKCFAYELGIGNASFIQFGYWDSLRKGLLSGEKLQYDLRRLESAYLEQNKREYEITKHISVAMLDPLALVQLRSTGTCEFEIPEVMYDMDHAGHYFRRIKSVSISLPCIAGPYTSVSANLLLKESRCRKTHITTTAYAENPEGSDDRFIYYAGGMQSIATSHAQNDSGVFELNFRDERYLPFEGAGAISKWGLELPSEIRQFDYNAIADIVVHLKYTAREGGGELKNKVNLSLKDKLNSIKQQFAQTGLHVAVHLKHELPNEWHLLKKNGTVGMKIDQSRLPYMVQQQPATIENIMFVANINGSPESFSINIDDTVSDLQRIDEWKLWYSIHSGIALDTPFHLSIAGPQRDGLEALIMIVKYRL